MRQQTRILSLPHYQLEIARDEAAFASLDEIVAFLREQIEEHPCARFIGVFDHHAHTSALPEGEIDPGVLGAKCVVFCFGMSIPEPGALATRPRSIGVAECPDRFVISFLEAPMPVANEMLEGWAEALVTRPPVMAARPGDDVDPCWKVGRNP